jgi:hypothetical protein
MTVATQVTQTTKITNGVVIPYFTATALVNYVYNNGDTMLIIRNDSGAPITATFDSLVDCNQEVDHDIVVTIADGTFKNIGMFSRNRFNNSSAQIKFTLSAFSLINIACVEVLT